MAMSAKAILKKTRESIDAKDYNEALKLSKSVLKDDGSNYVALVYAGVASQEIDMLIEAENFFEQAAEHNPSNPLAWQGLAGLYEKILDPYDDQDYVLAKLMHCYYKLIEFDSAKFNKLEAKLDKFLEHDGTLDTLQKLLTLSSLNAEIKEQIKLKLLNGLCDKSKIDFKYHLILKECYDTANPSELKQSHHISYLKMWYARSEYALFLIKLTNLSPEVRGDAALLEFQCEILTELYILNNGVYKTLSAHLAKFHDLLVESKSPIVHLATIIMNHISKMTHENILEVKEELEFITKQHPQLIQAWIIAADIYMKLQFNAEAMDATCKAVGLLSENYAQFTGKVNQLICFSHVKCNLTEHMQRVIEKGSELLNADPNDAKIMACVVEAYLNLGQIDSAKTHANRLESSDLYAYNMCKARIAQSEGDVCDAIQLLESQSFDTCDYWLLLGDLYWLTKSPKTLNSFLKATKANPASYTCYQRLGMYYQTVGDLDKARRCYEKSVKIKTNKISCVELSKIYRKLNKRQENLSLLLRLTHKTITADTTWAFFQLGIHYYAEENFARALDIFRAVIRFEPENVSCWECIADCYYSTGSYTSALKCYQKVKAINTTALYPLLQLANTRKLLGEYTDAKKEFEYILTIDAKYIPALKGAAETCVLLARQYLNRQLYGLARDAFQTALDHVSIALHRNAELSCCWKIAGDCCYMSALLPFKYSFLSVSGIINEAHAGDTDSTLIFEELLKMAIRVYCKALSYGDNVYVYHDLACSYVQYAKLTHDTDEKAQFLDHALAIIQHCIEVNALYGKHWNILGNIAFQLDPPRLELAQHAFVKAVSLDRNDAVAWTNLGTLYLCIGELKLANEVFSQAQKSNPNYVNCWIGQALIAEASEMDEAMDLFRHTMGLSYHPEGTIGYAHWVCKTILTKKRRGEIIYEIDNMHAIPVACDGLRWYVENSPRDGCAWNMFGMLSERMGLIPDAIRAYANAVKYSHKSQAITNLGRLYCSTGLYSKAIECFNNITAKNVNTEIAHALTLFKDEQFENAYTIYESVLESNEDTQHIQSDLLVALASIIYMFQGPEPAKQLLFQSTQLEVRSPWSLYAVLSLALLHEDTDLARLALKEIENLPVNEENLSHYANLLVYTHLIQGQYSTAISQLSRLIYKYPSSASLWLHLSTLLYRTRNGRRPNRTIAMCAQASLKLKGNNPDISMVLPIATATAILSGDLRNALKAAQRLVHYYPDNVRANTTLRFTMRRHRA